MTSIDYCKPGKYCSACHNKRHEGNWDYDLFKIAIDLDRGRSLSFLCFGCSNRAIYKDHDGNLYLSKVNHADSLEMHEVSITDLMY